jgi:hypothetical protein
MSDYGWMVLENIVWCAATVVCLIFLDGWWKLMAFPMLLMVNMPKSK